MKKVSIISAVANNVKEIPHKMNEIIELFKDKYGFEVFCYYEGKLPKTLINDIRFNFINVPVNTKLDDCISAGFELATGDCVIVADINNKNYIEYIINLLAEWEAKAQIVLIKKEQKKTTFWQKIKNFFVNFKSKIYNFVIGFANLNYDFGAYRMFQLYTKEVANVINEFPEKNYYLRNFDCWVDFRVSILYTSEKIKVKNSQKFFNHDFVCFLSSMVISLATSLFVGFGYHKISAENQATFFLLGLGIIIASLSFGLYNLYLWFIQRKTHLPQSTNK